MSMTIWFNVRHGSKHKSDETDHTAVFSSAESLDQLSTQLGIEPISTFFDETDVLYNMTDEIPESDDGWPAETARWHNPEIGLSTVSELIAHLQMNPQSVDVGATDWSTSDLMEDLSDLKTKLQRAVRDKKEFHFLVLM